MILVTGGTGFIGQALVRQLVSQGKPVRILIRPSPKSPRLPKSVSVEVTVCSIDDERGMRAAMKGIDTVYHLIGAEHQGSQADLFHVDIEGTRAVAQAAADARVERLFYMSHLGSDRASAFPVLKAKAIAENYIQQSGVPYTILRSGVAFGVRDHFTTALASLIRTFPGIFLLPEYGKPLLQPIWIEDLVTCLTWALDLPETINQVISVGGPEALFFREIIEDVIKAAHLKRVLLPISPAYLRAMTVWFEHNYPRFPISVFLLDYLAADRTCPVDTVPRIFGLLPAKFSQHLDHLHYQRSAINLRFEKIQRQL